jgi:hypothetical protein
MKVHYAGGVTTRTATMLPGWAACCSGERARKIRIDGNQTYTVSLVTCGACLKQIARQEQYIDESADNDL